MIKIDNLDNAAYRKFGFTMAGVIAFLFGLFFPWLFNLAIPIWPWAIAGILLLLAVIKPELLTYLYKPWMTIGHYVGQFNTKLILIIVFFLIFSPIAFLLKILGKDAMDRKLNKKKASYWIESTNLPKSHMETVY